MGPMPPQTTEIVQSTTPCPYCAYCTHPETSIQYLSFTRMGSTWCSYHLQCLHQLWNFDSLKYRSNWDQTTRQKDLRFCLVLVVFTFFSRTHLSYRFSYCSGKNSLVPCAEPIPTPRWNGDEETEGSTSVCRLHHQHQRTWIMIGEWFVKKIWWNGTILYIIVTSFYHLVFLFAPNQHNIALFDSLVFTYPFVMLPWFNSRELMKCFFLPIPMWIHTKQPFFWWLNSPNSRSKVWF